MADIVMITGTGRSYALGYNLVLRYLEAGDTVIATIRKPSADIEDLKEKYGDRLIVTTMDLLDTASVNAAAEEVAGKVDHIDTLIMNISSEAGSIEKCYRTNMIDYGMGKAALNMATMNLYNTFKDEKKVNIFAVHPGWIRTNGKADNPAPLSSYEAAGILKELFAKRREDFTGHRFITNEGVDYPF